MSDLQIGDVVDCSWVYGQKIAIITDKIYYEDEDGRKAHAKIKDKFEIRPTIVLPIEVSNENKTPNLEEIIKFTDMLLEKVKTEINY